MTASHGQFSFDQFERAAASRTDAMTLLLRKLIGFESLSGREGPLTQFVADWAKAEGFETDLWQGKEEELARRYPMPSRHLPLANRPTLVIKLPGRDPLGRSLIFNAHSDVVPAPDPHKWRANPWSGQEIDGRMYGRGACDTKGALVSALWSLLVLRDMIPTGLPGDIIVELIPGEEDCVGLGTLTSVARGYQSDGAIILEPTEGFPRNASRGGCRFDVIARGKAVHGTVKWLGKDAIRVMRRILDNLDFLEGEWNDRSAEPYFDDYPLMRPITVDVIKGGEWQGMICDECRCGGYLELLPRDNVQEWGNRLKHKLSERLGLESKDVEVRTSEQYDGHVTPADAEICKSAQDAFMWGTGGKSSRWSGWRAFNSGCEAGLRWNLLNTPTLVWGPGSLDQAHAIDEYVDLLQVRQTAIMFAQFAASWSSSTKDC